MSATEIVLQPLSADDNKHLYELFGDNKVLKSYAISPLSSTKQRDDIIRRITAKGCWTWKIQ